MTFLWVYKELFNKLCSMYLCERVWSYSKTTTERVSLGRLCNLKCRHIFSVNSQNVCVHPYMPMCAGECEHLVLIHLIFTVVGISFQLLSQFESSEEAGNR